MIYPDRASTTLFTLPLERHLHAPRDRRRDLEHRGHSRQSAYARASPRRLARLAA